MRGLLGIRRIKTVIFGAIGCAALGWAVPLSSGQKTDAIVPSAALSPGAPTTTDEVVERLVARNQQRAEQLKGYTDQRKYTVEYHGLGSLKASMTVDARYEAPSSKQFQIVSQTGPKLLVDRVLKKLLESEQEAAKNPVQTALTPANYTFALTGEQMVAGRSCYVLQVQPKVDSKFLYRGTVFVDAEDYAVVEIEAEPAHNPSFWIKKTHVHHTYEKTGQFWLPERNRSESAIRVGGTAVLTIDYGPYRVQGPATP